MLHTLIFPNTLKTLLHERPHLIYRTPCENLRYSFCIDLVFDDLFLAPAMTQQSIEAGGIPFAYEKYGTGREIFVLIHGWCSVRNFWAPAIAHFQEMGTVYNFDLIGHHPKTDIHALDNVDLVRASALQWSAIQKLTGKKRVTLVGHSTGGLLALAMACQEPRLVKRVIAVAPVIYGRVEGPLSFAKDLHKLNLHGPLHLPFQFMRDLPDAFKNIFEVGLHNAKLFFRRVDAKDYVANYREQMLQIAPEVMAAWLEIIDKADLRPLLKGNLLPTLFITGTHDKVVDTSKVRAVARTMPHAAYHEYASSGHIPLIEEEAECFENMRSWLANN